MALEIHHTNGRDVHKGDMVSFNNNSVRCISDGESVAKECVDRVGEIVSDGSMTVHMESGSVFETGSITKTQSGWFQMDTRDGRQSFTHNNVRYVEV